MIHLYTNNTKETSNQVNPVSKPETESRIVKASEMAVNFTGNNFASFYENQNGATDSAFDAFDFDIKNNADFMTVMASTMSGEDFTEMLEEGHRPSDMDESDSINSLDKIKAELARSGVIVEGYNDDLSVEEIEEVVGTRSAAEAILKEFKARDLSVTKSDVEAVGDVFDKAREINEITDGMCDYILRNSIEPTIDNLFTVRFSAAEVPFREAGYFTDESGHIVKDGDANLADSAYFSKKIMAIAKELNITDEAEKETFLEEGRWLVTSKILCNKANLKTLHELRAIKFPLSDEMIAASAANAAERGRNVNKAEFTKTANLIVRAIHIENVISNATNEDVSKLAAEGRELTVENLEEAKKLPTTLFDANNPEVIKNQRILAQVRLQMTVEAGYSMLKRGINVETTALSELVDTLKALESKVNREMFGGEDFEEKASLYNESRKVIDELPYIPVKTIGVLAKEESTFTLAYVYKAGQAVKEQYEKAATNYETLGTEVRKDLGDDIRKAFANIDDLLRGEGLEPDAINRRAVRILGYAEMEITGENIEEVSARDNELSRVITKMTPAATLELIRNNVNPLEVSLSELEDKLDSMDKKPENAAENYAKFICKLERSNDVSEEEKESFIGIYRLLDKIDKSDGKAIGELVKAKADINFKNLLTALRTGKSRGLDFKFDESIGELAKDAGYSFDIGKQIMTAFDTLLHTDDNTAYVEREYDNYMELLRNESPESVSELEEIGEEVTPETVNAMSEILADKKDYSPWKKMMDFSEEIADSDFDKSMELLSQNFDDKESVKKAYENVLEEAGKALERIDESSVKEYVDIKALRAAFKQITTVSKMAAQENYEVPVRMDRDVVNIRLKVIHKAEKEGKVFASFETEEFGKILGQFSVRDGVLNALIAGESERGIEKLKTNEEFEKSFANAGFDEVTFNYIQTDILNVDYFRQHFADGETNEVTTKQLYNVAKTFIQNIKKAGNQYESRS